MAWPHQKYNSPAISDSVRRFLRPSPPGGTLLDVACGSGRHVRFARNQGWTTTGIDKDLAGVRDLDGDPHIELIAADLEAGGPFALAGRTFDAVIVTNYLWRPILPDIVAAVAPRGLLIYETFAVGNERFGRPSNPDFLLRPGELLDAVRHRLVPIAYEHATLADPGRVVQRIAAVAPDHDWLIDPPSTHIAAA